jgi:hypothetical protein
MKPASESSVRDGRGRGLTIGSRTRASRRNGRPSKGVLPRMREMTRGCGGEVEYRLRVVVQFFRVMRLASAWGAEVGGAMFGCG